MTPIKLMCVGCIYKRNEKLNIEYIRRNSNAYFRIRVAQLINPIYARSTIHIK